MPEYISIKEAAHRYNVNYEKLRRMVRDRVIPALNFGNTYRINPAEVEKILKTTECTHTHEGDV